ncbi:GAF and ANTAR domain-containing protein [Streptomyces sp. NPDC052225]|uniref:GAF and ANTAR domain-containing protein n=1 Tax=Streptomyces sp. NPDC052225 TaxID=3154949 RepID=UPI0034447DCB
MSHVPRELRLATALVEFSDTLLDEFDAERYLGRLADTCVDLLEARGAGVSLLEADGRPVPFAHSSERPHLVRSLLAASPTSGPAHDSLRTGKAVPPVVLTSEEAAVCWPTFTAVALRHGITAAYAVPLRTREEVLGAVSIFKPEPPATEAELAIAQSLADAAALGLSHQRTYVQYRELTGQLQQALASRVQIEQAKGMLAERWNTEPDTAFTALRQYARRNRLPLDQVSRAVTQRTLADGQLRPDTSGRA